MLYSYTNISSDQLKCMYFLNIEQVKLVYPVSLQGTELVIDEANLKVIYPGLGDMRSFITNSDWSLIKTLVSQDVTARASELEQCFKS